jgi:multidrug resistance efflux pump
MGAISEASVSANNAVQGLLNLLQIGRRARAAATIEELGFIAVNETRALLAYRQAALWLGGTQARVAAVSGVPEVDPNAPFPQWLRHLFGAVALTEVGVIDPATLSPLLAEEWSSWLPAHALGVPLQHPEADVPGLLLLARDEPWQPAEIAVAAELGPLFGHALFALRPRPRLPTRVLQTLKTRRAWWRIAAAAAVVGALPVRLSTLATAEVAPTDPFVVRAPLDGVIDRVQVVPNQAVAAGAPLFDLDATTLRGQYDGARKAYETAQEQYRQVAQQAVTDDKSRVELAKRRGDLNLRAVDLDYAQAQLDRVQVHAERAGVAVFDDVNNWIGKAVVVGEKVLVLADPAKVELTAYMPAGDQVDLRPGAEVVFSPAGSPFSSYRAVVETVAYRAAPTDQGVLAYRVKARFAAGENLPRLGLSGSAQLYSGRVPLVYAVLRRPLATLRQWLGW